MARHSEKRPFLEWLSRPAVAMALIAVFGIALVTAPLLALRSTGEPVARPRSSVATPTPSVVETQTPIARQETPADEPAEAPKTELVAFYVNWGEEAYQSLEANVDKITVLMPMWYHVDSKGNVTIDNAEKQAQAMRLIKQRAPHVKVMPLVNNYDKATETWNAPAVSKLLAKPSGRKLVARNIVNAMKKGGFAGVNVDFENFTAADRGNLVAFMAELYPLAKKNGLTVSMDVIGSSQTYDYANLAKHVDYLIPMMYDQHWKTSGPGSISGIGWYTKTLDKFWASVPPSKTVIGLGTYSYDWGKKGERATSLTWEDARKIAAAEKRPIKLDPASLNSHFAYEKEGITRQVWMLDAISAFNSVQSVAKRQPRGYAIWRLGAEDPGLWPVLTNRDNLGAQIAESLKTDRRSVEYDATRGLITDHRLGP